VIVLASIAVAILATLYPARQAAGLAPIDAIRWE
jgi:ABC-type lipoprotein release transport system permease subunit